MLCDLYSNILCIEIEPETFVSTLFESSFSLFNGLRGTLVSSLPAGPIMRHVWDL